METSENISTPYKQTTDNITVSVEPKPQMEGSNPALYIFAFTYEIQIENNGNDNVQLVRRHWIITSGDKLADEVVGDGVVGLQPIIIPGQVFQYGSGAVIDQPMGSMEGIYIFQGSDGEEFEVIIPKFDLVFPTVYH